MNDLSDRRFIGERLEENQIIFSELWNGKSSVLPQIVHGPVNSNNRIYPAPSGRRCSWSQSVTIAYGKSYTFHRLTNDFLLEHWSYFRGDRVEVLVGRDKGKQGIVKQVIQERNWVIVEGLNCHFRIVGKEKEYPGVLIKSEAPLLVCIPISAHLTFLLQE